ncbi:hypothetical protein FOA52_016102 [Chlamydomonas sp. UWO 241]|nr:hypothetical protein FOA52_016102 [Chlamydomonas sp. UWO 241]
MGRGVASPPSEEDPGAEATCFSPGTNTPGHKMRGAGAVTSGIDAAGPPASSRPSSGFLAGLFTCVRPRNDHYTELRG